MNKLHKKKTTTTVKLKIPKDTTLLLCESVTASTPITDNNMVDRNIKKGTLLTLDHIASDVYFITDDEGFFFIYSREAISKIFCEKDIFILKLSTDFFDV
jgi:hypothetical protein